MSKFSKQILSIILVLTVLQNPIFINTINAEQENSSENISQTVSDAQFYTTAIHKKCNQMLETQVTSWKLSVSAWNIKQINAILPTVDSRYTDEQLIAINWKIIAILAKLSKTSLKFNTYWYLFVKVNSLTDPSKLSTDYIKTECALLTTPLTQTSSVGIAYLLEIAKLNAANNATLANSQTIQNATASASWWTSILDNTVNNPTNTNNSVTNSTNTSNGSVASNVATAWSTKIISSSGTVILNVPAGKDWSIVNLSNAISSNPYDYSSILYNPNLDIDAFMKKYVTDYYLHNVMALPSNQYESWRETIRTWIKKNMATTLAKRKMPFAWTSEYDLGSYIMSQIRPSKYNVSISSKEQKRMDDLDDLILDLQTQAANISYAELYSDWVGSINATNKINEIADGINQYAVEKIYLIRKKWEIKNVCVQNVANALALKDRDTYQIIGYKSEDEKLELLNEYRFAAYYGYSLYCDYYKLYPELSVKIDKLMTLTDDEFNNLYNNNSYTPTEANSSFVDVFIWDSWIKTSYDQAKFIYDTAMNMKKIHFEPIRRLRNGGTWTGIYQKVSTYKNENLIF